MNASSCVLKIFSRQSGILISKYKNFQKIQSLCVHSNSSSLCKKSQIPITFLVSRSYTSKYSLKKKVPIKLKDGLLVLSLPLPSESETCDFTLKPFSQTVGDLVSFIKQEDEGATSVCMYTKDGNRIAMSTSIDVLMRSDFRIRINDINYNVRPPASAVPPEDSEALQNVKQIVSRLYSNLNVEHFEMERERELLARLEDLQAQVAPLEARCSALAASAASSTRRLTWLGLGALGLQFGVLARLTWWEFSWDIMEPVTYFLTAGTSMAAFAYFLLTQQDYSPPLVRDRQMLLKFHKLAERENLDVDKLNRLREEIGNTKHDLRKLRGSSNTPPLQEEFKST